MYVTQDLQEQFEEIYLDFVRKGDQNRADIYKEFLNRFKKRNLTCYSCAGINEIEEKYDVLGKDQYWPLNFSLDYYTYLRETLSDEEQSRARLVPQDSEKLSAPVNLIELENVTFQNYELEDEVVTFEFVDTFHNVFYGVSLTPAITNGILENSNRSLGLYLQPTSLDALILPEHENLFDAPLFHIFLYSTSSGEGDQLEPA